MKLFLLVVLVAVGTYAIYKMLMWSRTKGKPDGNIAALIVALVMLYGAKIAAETPEPVKQPVKQTQVAARNISVAPRPTSEASSSDTQAKSRVKAYMDSLPGSMIVIVRGDSSNLIVETDYNFGTGDKAAAVDFAKDLIYQIQADNSDCVFKYISVNCMNGKNPVGAIVNYENGSFSTLP